MTPTPAKRIRPNADDTYTGKQGFSYFNGISSGTAGSTGICMHLVTVPPGGRTTVHLHENHETSIYVMSGEAENWVGENLEQHIITRAGDLFYIPVGMPHVTVNMHPTESATAVIARTDPNEQESVVLLPELEAIFTARLEEIYRNRG